VNAKQNRSLEGLSGESEESSEPEVPEEQQVPVFTIRNLKSGVITRSIPVQRGFSWKDVNAIASGFLLDQNVVPRGAYLDMSKAYWEQSETR